VNESDVAFEVDSKKMENSNRTNCTVLYTMEKDNAGNFEVNISYEKMRVFSKAGDSESEIDADNAAVSIDPSERMLGMVKQARLIATMDSVGHVKAVGGYSEMANRILASMNAGDVSARGMVHNKIKTLVEQTMVRKNLQQMFRIFPDSAVYLGASWKIGSSEKADFGLNVESIYTLQEIDNGIAVITVTAEIASDHSEGNLMGYQVTADLNGAGEGEYRVDLKSGMLIKGNFSSKAEGTLQLMSREVPITIKSSANINRIGSN
jgi:hypothetical protein